jgi:hypothetical protein
MTQRRDCPAPPRQFKKHSRNIVQHCVLATVLHRDPKAHSLVTTHLRVVCAEVRDTVTGPPKLEGIETTVIPLPIMNSTYTIHCQYLVLLS